MSSACEPAVSLKLAFSYQFRVYRGQVGGAFAHRRRAETLGALGLETVRFPLIHRYCPNRREIKVLGCRRAREGTFKAPRPCNGARAVKSLSASTRKPIGFTRIANNHYFSPFLVGLGAATHGHKPGPALCKAHPKFKRRDQLLPAGIGSRRNQPGTPAGLKVSELFDADHACRRPLIVVNACQRLGCGCALRLDRGPAGA